jgi:hypothetical protein
VKAICALIIIFESVFAANAATPKIHALRITSTRDLAKYIGTYPCTNGLLRQPILLSSLKRILDGDYNAYREHMKFSGCGAIEKRDRFLLMDVSQLHVGGYTSLIFVRLQDGVLFLFWLKSTVAQKEYRFYGPKPIPAAISQTVEQELNTTWGRVAQFHVRGENDQIDLVPEPR